MSSLIIPETTPPQVSERAADKIIDQIFIHGLHDVYDYSLFTFKQRHPAFYELMKKYTFEQNGKPIENQHTYAALRIGAVVASLAYDESGFDQPIDERATEIGALNASLEGLPEAYLTRYVTDPGLQKIVDILPETPLMQADIHSGSYEEILALGAGTTRFYLQQALAA